MAHQKFRSGASSNIGVLCTFFEKTFFRISGDFCCKLPRKPKICSSLMKNLQNVFSSIGHKMSMGRVPIKIFGVSELFYRKFVKTIFEIEDPPNRRFWGFFQKSILEISSKEKKCFWRSRFFWKIEEMGVYFWGCARKIFYKFVLLIM